MILISLSRLRSFLLYSYVASIPFDSYSLLSQGGLTMSWLIGSTYIVVSLFAINFKISSHVVVELSPLIALLCLFFISSAFSLNSISSSLINISYASNIIFSLLVIQHLVEKRNDIVGLYLYYSISSIFSATLFFFDVGVEYYLGRLKILGEDSNYSAIKYAIAIFFIFSYIQYRNIKTSLILRVFLLFGVGLLALMILYTASRVGFISMMMSFSIMLFAFLRAKSFSGYLKSIALFVFVAIFYINLDNDLFIFERLFSSIEDGDLSERDLIWKAFLDSIPEVNIFGVGYSGYNYISMNVFSDYKSTHNVFIEIYILGGWLGVIIFGYFISKLLYASISSFNGSQSNSFYFLPQLIGCMISLQFFTFKLMWLIVSLIVAFNLIYKEEK